MSLWAYAIGFSLLLVSGPAGAQNTDPFQSAPVVATPAPKPRPQPHSAVEPDPYAAAPPAPIAPTSPPVATLPPSSVIWARVRQVAQTDGISVPLASDPPFDASSVPPQLRILVGAWGPGAWQGSPVGDKLILIVLGVDGGASVRGVVARNLGTDWSYFSAPVTGNGFSIHIQTSYEASGRFNTTRALEDDYWQFELRADGRLYGSRSATASTIVLAKLQ
ncbi:MAG TPA: hypothetical protein VGR70_09685 [Stellaceae bacterium]|nr:hypothetical protein [Stellaceae bacterium]